MSSARAAGQNAGSGQRASLSRDWRDGREGAAGLTSGRQDREGLGPPGDEPPGEAGPRGAEPRAGGAPGALRESEARFRTLVENVSDIVVELDEHRFICWLSPSIKEVVGRDPASMVGVSILPLIHRDDVAGLLGGLEEAYASMQSVDFSYRLRHANGEWRWIEGAGRCFPTSTGAKHFVGAGRDVTDYKRLLDTLERRHRADQQVKSLSERFLAASTSRLREAALEVLEGTARLAHADSATILPLPRPARGAAPLAAGFDPVAWPQSNVEPLGDGLSEACWSELRRGRVVRLEEGIGVLPSDPDAWSQLVAGGVRSMIGVPLLSKQGPVGVLALACRDEDRGWSEHERQLLGLIGEMFSTALQRLQAEAELQESQARLLQSQKMDAIGQLAGGISHEFNNLLTIILGYCRFLQLAAGAELQHDLDQIHRAADRAADLTRHLLTFSRREPGQASRVDLNEVVFAVQRLVDRFLGVEVTLELELSEHPRCVEADATHLEQVLINLVVNARDAMPDGGRILVSTSERRLDPKDCLRLGLATPGLYSVLEVKDTGHGIREDVIERIFEPFYTTKDVGDGTGLGLAIAYSVVREHGGAIEVVSKPECGATFRILLPRSEAPAEPEPAPGPAVRAHGDETLLIVEDEEGLRRMAVRIASRAGYRVHEADSGPAALELMESIGGDVDLLVSDVMMPGMSGYELADRLSDRLADRRAGLPAILISGHPAEQGRVPDAVPKERRLLRKPFTAEELLAAIRETLDER